MKRWSLYLLPLVLSGCNLQHIGGDPCQAFGVLPTWPADRYDVTTPATVTFTAQGEVGGLCPDEPRQALVGARVYGNGRLLGEAGAQDRTVTVRWSARAGQDGLPARGDTTVNIEVVGVLAQGTTPVKPANSDKASLTVHSAP